METLVQKIKRQNRIIVVFVVAFIVALAIGFVSYANKVKNGPEQEYARSYLVNSDSLKAKYGKVVKIKCTNFTIHKNLSESTSSGMFEFEITGANRTGTERLTWDKVGDGDIKVLSVNEVHAAGLSDVMRDIKNLFSNASKRD